MGQQNPTQTDDEQRNDPLPAMDHRGLTAEGKSRLRESLFVQDYLVRGLEDADQSILRAISSACDKTHGKRHAEVMEALYDDDADSSRAIRDAYWALLKDVQGLGLLASELRSDQIHGTPSEDEPRSPW